MKSTVWKTVKGQLAHRTDRDFEREVLRGSAELSRAAACTLMQTEQR